MCVYNDVVMEHEHIVFIIRSYQMKFQPPHVLSPTPPLKKHELTILVQIYDLDLEFQSKD